MTDRDDYKRLADRLIAQDYGNVKDIETMGEHFALLAECASALRAASVKAGEPCAWIAFADTGFIRFWTADKERADREKTNGLDLRGFTLAELVALAAKPAPTASVVAMREERDRYRAGWNEEVRLRQDLQIERNALWKELKRVLLELEANAPNAAYEIASKALAAANQSDVEALAATTAGRPGTVTSEPEPSTSDTPPAPQAVDAVSVDTIARICADDLVPIIETATRVANRTGHTFVIDRQKVATMIAGHFNRAILAKFKMEGR